MADINNVNELAKAFEEFKSTNDTRLAEIESKGSADVVTTDKLEKLNGVISALQADVTNLGKKSNRIGTGEEDADAKAYGASFNGYLRKGVSVDYELEQKAIATVGGDPAGSTGGHLLPKQVESGLFTGLERLSPIRSLATVVQVSTDDYRFLSNLHGTDANWVAETGARPETSTPTFSETRVPMGELYAQPGVTQRALDDLAVNVEQLLSDEAVRAFALLENTAFIKGSGTNSPQGIMTTDGIAQVKTGVAAGIPTADADFILKMIYGLKSPYRQNARFASASSTIAAIRSVKNTEGSYLWQPSLIAGEPATLAGYAHVEIDEMDALGAGKFPLLFGDFAQGYMIADRIGVRLTRDNLTKKPFVLFYFTKRVGGMVKDKNAFIKAVCQA